MLFVFAVLFAQQSLDFIMVYFSCFLIDLKVSMSRSRENGSIIVGDSLNLTCKLDCPGNLAEVQWFKNGELMQHSAPVLIFSSVTTKDSGNYSCSLRNFKSSVSEEFRIYIEGWLNCKHTINIFMCTIFIFEK